MQIMDGSDISNHVGVGVRVTTCRFLTASHSSLGPFICARLRSELELAEAASQAGSSAGLS